MKPIEFLNKTGTINTRKMLKHSTFIEENYGLSISSFNPSLSQRLKYEIEKPRDIFCTCGEPLKFSSDKLKTFKLTCGSMHCVSKVRRKVKADLSKKSPYKKFTNDEVKRYIQEKIDANVKPNYFNSFDNSISLFITSEAKRFNMKMTQYCWHIYNSIPITEVSCKKHDKKLVFNNFSCGYHNPMCCSKAADNRKKNSILNKTNDESRVSVVQSFNINEQPWLVRCKICFHEFNHWMKDGRSLNDARCQKCSPLNKSSYEYRLIDAIKSFYDGEIIHSFRLKAKEIDIYIPEIKLGIEVNGIYWHSDSKYRSVDKNKHRDKYLLCRDNGVTLIQITDKDIDQNFDLVISMIKNKFGLNSRIHARSCNIREIDNKVAKKFCIENHIKGYAASKYRLGMFYNDELISIFTLRKSRFNESNYELIRFCTKKNFTVVGGLSKFLSFINKKLNIDQLISYADLHYGTGNCYEKIGFEKIGETPPNYYYIVKGAVKSRQQYQKNKLVKMGYPANKTEAQITKNLGFSRYYDCGSIKFIWRRPPL